MIKRRDAPSILITQTAHGWLSGQFAICWGNEKFALPALANELRLAAINHDNGWYEWEQAPQLDQQGQPLDFLDMAAQTHLDFWRKSIGQMRRQSRYAALLVSLHSRYLLEARLRVNQADTAADKAAIQAFINGLLKSENALKQQLTQQTYFKPACADVNLQANFRLLQIFDWLSLLVCMRPISESVIEDVPGASASERLTLQVKPLTAQSFTIDPWPFDRPEFCLAVQMHHLPQETFSDDEQFQQAWQQSRLETRIFTVQQRC